MAIEFSSFLGNINNTIYSMPFLNCILSSVVYTSIILSILIIIMVLFIYPCKKDTPGWVLVKLFIYIFAINTIIFSARYSMMSNQINEKSNDESSSNFITNINRRGGSNVYNNESIKVVPNFSEHRQVEDDSEYNEHKKEERPISNKVITASDMLDDVEKLL